ncbi:MAG: hypothetical protein IM618_11020 [Cytophagales bacterium]|jgi:hypothetical protein|nr:hypothetical protein [Cytophagales bacterium]
MSHSILGSEKYGTSVIKQDEYLLLAETIVDNGSDLKTCVADIEFIDDCLSMSRMIRTIGKAKSVMYTKNGNVRKNRSISDFISNRLDSMVIEKQ